MKTTWTLETVPAEAWLEPDAYAQLVRRYGGERNLRALVFGLRPDLVRAELEALRANTHDATDSAHQK